MVAPTTLLTGLLYYFGYMHAYYLFDYFGVNSTALGFGTADYLIRSIDALFVPVTVAALAALVTMWGMPAFLARVRTGSPATYVLLLRSITVCGLAVTLAGGFLTVATNGARGAYVALAPVCFGAGVLVLAYAAHRRRVLAGGGHLHHGAASGWAAATEWMIAFILVGISLFAAATDYAGGVGLSRARQIASELRDQPAVLLYSQHDLDLNQPGVSRTRCGDPDAEYRYRYDGLVLLLESGGKYLLLPRQWTPADGGAILLAETTSIRLEFYPGTAAPAASATAC